MKFVALRAGGKVPEFFDAPACRETARAIARTKFGDTVERVLSAADYYEERQEQAALERNKRIDGDGR